VVQFILVERSDSDFHLLLLAVLSRFNCLLSALIYLKRKAKDFFPDLDLTSKQAFFCYLTLANALKASLVLLFEFGNCFAISRVVIVLVTIVTPHIQLSISHHSCHKFG
jgi:hypothetical protein